ncbi:MAG: amidase [Castellaniella sp.]|uniref:amidase family protein n=1 Tax=Castellaniella sp. TaxID=1955812 RepID=UPI0012045FAB|nr:amidase family protein [Castellaniella sp.]TAN29121.1 MAG: amidase [Castellaniella sp.]
MRRNAILLMAVLTGVAAAPAQAKPDAAKLMEATIQGTRAQFAAGALTCHDLVEFYLDRIHAYDQKGAAINTMLYVNPAVLKEADRMDAAHKAGSSLPPLWCVPVVLKDNYDTKDMPTTGGSKSLQKAQPAKDATVVARLRKAGALVLGKTNLSEFALTGVTRSSLGGQTKNPYDLTRTPGGSSGGTGAALAANFALAGTGSDTVNSVRSPASANSVVGFRATNGLVSRAGIIPVSATQDSAGPLARTVSDVAIMLQVMAGYDPEDPKTGLAVGHVAPSYVSALKPDGLKNLRVGVLKTLFGNEEKNRPVNKVMAHAIDIMKQQGAVVVEVENPKFFTDMLGKTDDVQKFEYQQLLNGYLAGQGDHVPVHTLQEVLASGGYDKQTLQSFLLDAENHGMNEPEYWKRITNIRDLRIELANFMAKNQLDVLVFPEQRELVAEISTLNQPARNGHLAALTGFPEITLPAGFSAPTQAAPLGVPVGLSILGRPWSEFTLLHAAYSFEQAANARKPPRSTPPLSE